MRRMSVAIRSLALVAAGGIGYGLGQAGDGASLPAELRLEDWQFSGETYIHANGDVRYYANLREAREAGHLERAPRHDPRAAEALAFVDAVRDVGQYPDVRNTLYAYYRSLEHRVRTTSDDAKFAAYLLGISHFAEATKYLAVIDGEAAAYAVADRAQACVELAVAERRTEMVGDTCLVDLATGMEPILGFRPITGARSGER